MFSIRQNIIKTARDIWQARPTFLDTETTGLHDTAEIIELCLLDYDGSPLLQTLVRPRLPIPPDVVRVHGITDEMVHDAPRWFDIWPDLEALLRGRPVGIYNAEFDLRMLQQSHRLNGLPWRPPQSQFFCIMKMYADFSGARKWQRLEDAGAQCGLALQNTHRACYDTLLARAVFQHMVEGGR